MTAPTHQACGITFGLVALFISITLGFSPTGQSDLVIYFGMVILGALLPDLDHPSSRIGRRIPFISYPLYWLFGHRTWTHSLMFILISIVLGFVLGGLLNWSLINMLALSIGVTSHIIGDYFFDGGVPLFYPVNKGKFRFVVTAKTRRPGTLGVSEHVVFLLLIGVSVYLAKVVYGLSNFNLGTSIF